MKTVDASDSRQRVVMLSDDENLILAVELALDHCGYELEADVATKAEFMYVSASLLPDLAVVDLTLAGMAGLAIVGALRELSPGVAVVVLCPFANLHQAAMEAGAVDLLETRDVRGLQRCLMRLRAGVATVCTCQLIRRPPNTSPAFDPAISSVSLPSRGERRGPAR